MMLVVILAPSLAKADGGVVRAREAQGPLLITIFTPPEIFRDTPTEVTIMVQRASEVMLDAEIDLTFVPPVGAEIEPVKMSCGSYGGQLLSMRATRTQSANKLLYGTSVALPTVGDWRLEASVQQGGGEVRIHCILPVGMPARRLAYLWPYLALPPFFIGLFTLNQWLRRRTA